jgi:nucleolar protein 9
MEKRKRGSRGGSAQKETADVVIKKTRRGGRGRKGLVMDDVHDDVHDVHDDVHDVHDDVHDVAPQTQVESDTKAYLLSMEQVLDDAEEKQADDLEIIVQNIYREIDGTEVEVACEYETCRILEKVLMLSNDFLLRVFAEKIQTRIIYMIRDPYGSHVLETLLIISADVVAREENGKSWVELQNDEELITMNEFVLQMSKVIP